MLSGNFLYGHAIEISIGLSSYANILSDFPGEALEIVRSRWSDKNNRTAFITLMSDLAKNTLIHYRKSLLVRLI